MSSLRVQSGAVPTATSGAPKRGRRWERPVIERLTVFAVGLLATAHIVWFYVNKLPSYLNLELYETGQERMPFQARLLMEYPLRWAHGSPLLNSAADWLTAQKMWLPNVVRPEDLVEFAIGFVAVAVAGMVARDMYRAHSKSGRLIAYVYPFYLVMVAGSYCLLTTHFFRYVYDLPSLGLFSSGLYLVYRKRSPLLFALVFVAATLNRETSLFLLAFFLLSACVVGDRIVWRRALDWKVCATVVPLAAFWLAWHAWTAQHFAGLPNESVPRVRDNVVFLLSPYLRAQIFGVAAYTVPILLIFKSRTRNLEMRLWAWVLPVWAVLMLFYGMFVEIRLFGELIPLFVCLGVLLAEERLLLAEVPKIVEAPKQDAPPYRGADRRKAERRLTHPDFVVQVRTTSLSD